MPEILVSFHFCLVLRSRKISRLKNSNFSGSNCAYRRSLLAFNSLIHSFIIIKIKLWVISDRNWRKIWEFYCLRWQNKQQNKKKTCKFSLHNFNVVGEENVCRASKYYQIGDGKVCAGMCYWTIIVVAVRRFLFVFLKEVSKFGILWVKSAVFYEITEPEKRKRDRNIWTF